MIMEIIDNLINIIAKRISNELDEKVVATYRPRTRWEELSERRIVVSPSSMAIERRTIATHTKTIVINVISEEHEAVDLIDLLLPARVGEFERVAESLLRDPVLKSGNGTTRGFVRRVETFDDAPAIYSEEALANGTTLVAVGLRVEVVEG